MDHNKGFANIVVIVVVVAIVVGVAGYLFLQGSSAPITQNQSQNTSTQNEITTPPPAQTPSATSNKSFKQDISSIFQASGGCGDVYVYQTNKDSDMGISVGAEKDTLNLSTTAKTFRIEETNSDDLKVELRVGENVGFLYCNDVVDLNQPEYKTLSGNTGEITISISEIDETQIVGNRNYTTTVILKNVHFIEENGNDSDMVIDELIFKDVRVGWFPG